MCADIADVESGLVTVVTAALYPNGTGSSSIIGTPCKIYAGWPLPTQLDPDMVAAVPIVHVSVFTQPGMEQNVSRYPRVWFDQVKTTPTITATVVNNVITLGGTVTLGHYVSVLVGWASAYSYAALAADVSGGLNTFATNLAATIPGASAVGPVITLPATTAGLVKARTGAPGVAVQELERTLQQFLVTVWAPNNALRVAASMAVRSSLAQIDYLPFSDTSCGRLLYASSSDMDRLEKDNVYRRDIHYSVEYPTTITTPVYPMTIFQTQIASPDDQGTTVVNANA